MVHLVDARGHRGDFDVLHRQPAVFRVEPERVELAMLADDFDQFRTQKLSDTEHPHEFPLSQQLLDLGHDE